MSTHAEPDIVSPAAPPRASLEGLPNELILQIVDHILSPPLHLPSILPLLQTNRNLHAIVIPELILRARTRPEKALFHSLVLPNNTGILRLLLRRGFSFTVCTQSNAHLHTAPGPFSEATLQEIVATGPNAIIGSAPGTTSALAWAVTLGRKNLCRTLLECGAHVEGNPLDDNVMRPLHIALSESNVDAVRLLLEYNADPRASWGGKGMSALHTAVGWRAIKEGMRGSAVDFVAELVRSGADADVRDEDGESVLGLAVRRGDAQVVEYLMGDYQYDMI